MNRIGENIYRYNAACVLTNLLLVYLLYFVCRIAFVADNWSMFAGGVSASSVWMWLKGGTVFDTAALFYTNGLYIILMLFPLHVKETRTYHAVCKYLFVIVNMVCVVANLMDTVYFPFSQRRATAHIFDEFGGESNLLQIIGVELLRHWYFVALTILLGYVLIRFYRLPSAKGNRLPMGRYYAIQAMALLLIVPLAICGIRGGATTAIRPITVSNAHQYVNRSIETGIVLNTPFAVLRTAGRKAILTPHYFTDKAVLDSIYSPLHFPADSMRVRKKNVVILIVESFAKEFIGGLNPHLEEGKYQGYTEFTDSLLPYCLTYRETLANGNVSIDAMPSILSSIPQMRQSFVLTPYSLDDISGIAGELKRWGYHTAFFHGAENSSMGFQAFARSAGFDHYYGRTEYNADERFGGDNDFDGTWAIWDEPFLQFFCTRMNQMDEPFCTSVFTASSHHPFALPSEYQARFPDEGKFAIHKCIRYTDHALRRFFDTAKRQPWYLNTLFVLTADHASSRVTHDEYKTEMGQFAVPILFFDPSGEMPVGCRDGIAQQIDIMPTLLSYLGYPHPYVAFGKDLFSTPESDAWAMNWNEIPQYVQGDHLLQLQDDSVRAVFNYRTDPLLRHNLKGKTAGQSLMERKLKAVIQSCMERMSENKLRLTEEGEEQDARRCK